MSRQPARCTARAPCAPGYGARPGRAAMSRRADPGRGGRAAGISGGQAVRAHDGCLGDGRRRRTRQAAIVPGEAHAALDPGVSEWSNPAPFSGAPPPREHMARRRGTGGSETSQYPEEKKSTEIPQVAASERGEAQTGGLAPRGRGTSAKPWRAQRRPLESGAIEGDSPVRETPVPGEE